MDFYASGYINEVDTANGETTYPNYPNHVCVPWGTGTWTQLTIDFVVPTTIEGAPWGAYAGNNAVVPTGVIPWISCDVSSGESGIMYVTNTVLYINPSG
jgi:hypothetical protein